MYRLPISKRSAADHREDHGLDAEEGDNFLFVAVAMKRILYGVAIVLCYTVLYWVSISVWSFAGFATIGRAATRIDVLLRVAAFPFLLGALLAFGFRERLQMWALGVAPFAASAALLISTDVNWHEIKDGVLWFWVISAVAACAAMGGGAIERRSRPAR